MKIFIYGTLKKGFSNHDMIKRKIKPLIKKGTTVGKYCLYQDIEPFPYLEDISEIGKCINGQVVELLNDYYINDLDYFEGVPDLYFRKEIEVIDENNELTTCWAYFKTNKTPIEEFNENELLNEWIE